MDKISWDDESEVENDVYYDLNPNGIDLSFMEFEDEENQDLISDVFGNSRINVVVYNNKR